MAADRLCSYLYAPRQALFAAPFFLLFAAEGLRGVRGRASRIAAATAVAALALGTHLELTRQQALRGARNERMVERTRAAVPGRPLLFDEPNFAAFMLFHFDRDAFLQLRPPRREGDFYLFGWPERLTAGGHPIEVVWDPGETPKSEARRWRAMSRRVASGELPVENIQFGMMREEPKRKANEWMGVMAPLGVKF
jgi:hypothetical protein